MKQDIFEKYKKAVSAEEQKDFPEKELVWEKIEEKLDGQNKDRLPVWIKYGAVASVLILIGFFSIWKFNPSINDNQFGLEKETNQTIIDNGEKETKSFLTESELINEKDKESLIVDSNTIIEKVEEVDADKISIPYNIETEKTNLSLIETPLVIEHTPTTENITDQTLIKESVTTVELAETVPVEKKPDISQLLSGQVSGVKVTTAENNNPPIVIRGATSIAPTQPTYIVDGQVVGYSQFQKVSSENINSVRVIKDDSATALYGSQASNGVVIINTDDAIDQQKAKSLGYNSNLYSLDTEEYESFEENQFENPQLSPLSTFSVDVDKASYSNIRRLINLGQAIPKDAVRIEEMINYFDYNYPEPTTKHPIAIHTEYSDAPWNDGHRLLKIGIQGKSLDTANKPKSNIVFLLDVSGSMNNQNKLPLLKSSLKLLIDKLDKKDKVSIVVYAGAAGLVLKPTNDKSKILAALDNLSAGGSTAGGEGIELAYKTAEMNFIKNGNNRVILATDGDFNIGASSDEAMEQLIEEKRKTGIYLTCLGYGMGNYKDSKLEILADKGNGNYAYIDNIQEANKVLVQEFFGTLYTIAKDVKVQVEFNPRHVQSYRLIGYENRKLRAEDFANDKIDAGEIGAGHTVTALYEIIPNGVESPFLTDDVSDLKYADKSAKTEQLINELATVKFRYKLPDESTSKELVEVVQNHKTVIDNASDNFQFAAAVAWFGLKLRDSDLVGNKDIDDIIKLAKSGKGEDKDGYRSEMVRLAGVIK